MKKKLIIVIFIIISFGQYSSGYSEQSNNFIFLFDNSGSMSGYYREANSSFKLFAKALIKNSLKPNDNANVLLFSKTEKHLELESPKVLYQGSSNKLDLNGMMKNFVLMRDKNGDLGNTDLIEALDKGINFTDDKTSIIWLITDNINDNSGRGDSSYLNTIAFYNRLRNDNNIKKILLYPIQESIVEDGYTSNGYVVYGIVYSKENLSQKNLEYYDSIFRSVGIKQKPVTLKPLDIGTIVLNPKINQSKIIPHRLFYDGKTLRGFDFEEGESVKEVFNDLTLKSNLYPYIIKSAKLDVKLDNFVSSDYSVKSLGTQSIIPSTVSNVSPEGEVTGFSVTFNMPEISPKFSFNTIFNDEFTIGGDLVLEVSNVDILLDTNYTNNFQKIFGLQTVPEIFKPYLKDKKIITIVPLEIKMKYGPWRIFVLIGLILFVIIIFSLIVILLLKKKCIAIFLDEEEKEKVCLNSFSNYNVFDYSGILLGNLKKTFSGNIRFKYSKSTTFPNRSINLKNGIPVAINYNDSGMKEESISIMIQEIRGQGKGVENSNENSNFY